MPYFEVIKRMQLVTMYDVKKWSIPRSFVKSSFRLGQVPVLEFAIDS